MERDWKSLYMCFRDVWERYGRAHAIPQIGRQVVRQALNPRYSFEQVAQEIKSFDIPIELSKDWHRIEQLRDAFDDLGNDGVNLDTPAASVYQTAIQIMQRSLEHALDREGERRWFYRGQRSSRWPVSPSMFRRLANSNKAVEEYRARLERVRNAVHSLREVGLGQSEFEALAIVQHYSTNLGVTTWLLDVTSSPYVALFFASDGGQEGDIGSIDYIERTAWLRFSNEGQNLVGTIRYVSPAGIPRIENQAAFFLEAIHPELYRQLSVRALYFRQQPGVVFEDVSLDPPVSRHRIYPEQDPVEDMLPKELERGTSTPLAWEPPPESLRPPGAAVFSSIVQPWLGDISRAHQEVVAVICSLHAAITRRQGGLPYAIGTLHQLRRVVESVTRGTVRDPKELLELFYLPHVRAGTVRDTFMACLIEACPEWEPIARASMGSV